MTINEIIGTSYLPPAKWDKNILQYSTFLYYVDGFKLYHYSQNNEFYMLIDDKHDLQAFLVTKKAANYPSYEELYRMENVTKIHGLITAIMISLVGAGRKFVIDKNEPLTEEGLKWLLSIIGAGGRGLKITGNNLDINQIEKEWQDSQFDPTYKSSIEFFIENKNIEKETILLESQKWIDYNNQTNINLLIVPYCKWRHDKKLW